MKSEKFLRTHLDHPNHLELSREIGFCAQGIFAPHKACKQRGTAEKRELICPTGKSFRG
jgi:hypothetical protein